MLQIEPVTDTIFTLGTPCNFLQCSPEALNAKLLRRLTYWQRLINQSITCFMFLIPQNQHDDFMGSNTQVGAGKLTESEGVLSLVCHSPGTQIASQQRARTRCGAVLRVEGRIVLGVCVLCCISVANHGLWQG